jgi:hypothetical protein
MNTTFYHFHKICNEATGQRVTVTPKWDISKILLIFDPVGLYMQFRRDVMRQHHYKIQSLVRIIQNAFCTMNSTIITSVLRPKHCPHP